ncbi:hypothetical protein BJ912DRAFT_942328, partial [Pholiota molesta]
IHNPDITAKWKQEALASHHENLTAKLVDYCYQTFEAKIPERLKDWHPWSDGKVWNLVHPSLFPLVYGRTRILENCENTTLEDCIEQCGQGKITEIPGNREAVDSRPGYFLQSPYSRTFQWLPCEVDISGDKARITSYINNLHPHTEEPLYHLLEKLIDAYNHVVSANSVILPEPELPFVPLPSPPRFSLKDGYGKRGLQVIVKMANIELTPEKPNYDGGSWHIDGQLNEHIVATALYYYSSSNITPSSLFFRQWFSLNDMHDLNLSYPQDVSGWLAPIYGCRLDGPSVQDVGGVDTREGRLLTFPNILQHRVGPFELANPTKPGHRKIVALFLVDPNIKVISTAHVPCQQQEWWHRILPRELQDHILGDVDFPISLQEAKELRQELMKERMVFSFDHLDVLNSHFTIAI